MNEIFSSKNRRKNEEEKFKQVLTSFDTTGENSGKLRNHVIPASYLCNINQMKGGRMNGATTSDTTNNISVFLFGAILNILAAVDYASLLDYSLKAILGGLIWLGFKVIGEMITRKMKQKSEDKDGD